MADNGFLRTFFERLPCDEGIHPELEDLLGRALETARQRWPKLRVEESSFAAHLARHAAAQESAILYLSRAHVADLYISIAAAEGDSAAIQIIETEFIQRVGEYVVRTTVDRDVVDEVKQRLRTEFFLPASFHARVETDAPCKLLGYSGRGPLAGWMRVAAIRAALNCMRGRGKVQSADDETTGIALDPELSYVHAASDDVFREAFRTALANMSAEDKSILRLHYMQGLTMDQLAVMFATSRSSIARRVADVRASILASTERFLREERGLSPTEVASLVRRADSQLNVTITKLFDS